MSDDTSIPAPKPTVRVGGLSRAAQKLQAAKEKAAGKSGAKAAPSSNPNFSFKGKDAFAGTKKSSFQRKAT